MTPHQQRIAHDPENGRYGDCHRTCIAAILDMEPEDVPHMNDGPHDPADPDRQTRQANEWLAGLGLRQSTFAWWSDGFPLSDLLHQTAVGSPGVPMILGGASSLGVNHSVVIMDGEIVCDPSGNGIVGPLDCGQWQITTISVGKDWGAR